MSAPSSEVKGIWFSSLHRFLNQQHGPESVERLIAALPPTYQDALADPLVSAWYPEDALGETLRQAHALIADGDDASFETLIQGVTVQGVGRFFRVLLYFTSPTFVLSKIPTVWDRLRRGPGRVMVDTRPKGALVKYRSFPYFDERTYQLMTVAAIRGMLEACGAKSPRIAIVAQTHDSLDVEVET
jgi:hypothetical protein